MAHLIRCVGWTGVLCHSLAARPTVATHLIYCFAAWHAALEYLYLLDIFTAAFSIRHNLSRLEIFFLFASEMMMMQMKERMREENESFVSAQHAD